jgi:hypothetical protein
MRLQTTRTACAAVLLAAGLTAAGHAATRSLDPFTGDAVGRDGGLRYRETHDFDQTSRGLTQTTIYRDATGREIGRMTADYSTYRFAPAYRMVDLRHGTEEVVRRDGSLVHVERRRGEKVESRTLQLDSRREVIVGPGFNEFVTANWDRLLAGETILCDFVIPSRMQLVSFRIQHVPEKQSAQGYRFRVSVDNAFLRLLAPDLHVEYDRQTRALLTYDGPSNVNDDRDKSQTVSIRFAPRGAPATQVAAGSQR